jgi:TonB family protein
VRFEGFLYSHNSSIVVLQCAEMLKRVRILRCLALAIGVLFLIIGYSRAQDQQSSTPSDALYRDQVHALAGRILKRADRAKCRPKGCTVLVANFTTSSGSTSRLGIQLADSISEELLAQGKGIQIIDRSRLRDYLVREHIPSRALKDREAARWLATEFQANAVLIGSIEQQGDHFDLLVELLNASNEKAGTEEAIDISIPDQQGSLAPLEPYEANHPGAPVTTGQRSTLPRAGAKGISNPECMYCPTPLYTDQARKAKFNGSVVLEVVVTEDGRAEDIRVLKGVPFGLNEQAVKTVSRWKLKPAAFEEKPVAVLTPIEMTFRTY